MVRNSEGRVQIAATKREALRVTPLVVEALGLRWCLQWTTQHLFENIIVETDAEQVVKCLNGSLTLASIVNIILDCRDLLDHMHNINVVSVKRVRNLAAHALVKVAKNLGSRTWVGAVPDQVIQIICNDFVSV